MRIKYLIYFLNMYIHIKPNIKVIWFYIWIFNQIYNTYVLVRLL